MRFFRLSRRPANGKQPLVPSSALLRKPGRLRKLEDKRGAELERRGGRAFVQGIVVASALSSIWVWSPSHAEPHRFVTVPALAVSSIGGKEIGNVHYIVIQLDQDLQRRGPTVLFSERFTGSVVSEDWKEGARVAVDAAASVLGEDPRNWTITIKNRTNVALTAGSSASSAVAVGIMAAWHRDALRPGVALTGAITADGRIGEVDGLPSKLEGAATARMHTMLVPKGQARTSEWDLYQQGGQRNIAVIEVGSLREAYELMTGKKP